MASRGVSSRLQPPQEYDEEEEEEKKMKAILTRKTTRPVPVVTPTRNQNCIPCGHVYGRLCLEKWLRKCKNKGKCPQCNVKFNPKQIINLYAPRIVVPNDDLEKEVKFLRENIKSLILEKARLLDVIDKRLPRVEFMSTQTYFYNLSQGMPFQYPPHGLFDIDFYERAGHAPPPPPYPHPYQPPPPLENQDE
ncbi:E3 ubiquitin-protein ligase RFWD3-like isoform X3 [Carex littledalei]|uniref:E3 ubiquitin-protein ligase RFWD3-like isoform X3 n=1 Tax=Carex littledalei TaxID=544730 RepID=A0A833QWN0_9POAL|nr:E3 ubiquitin-protein ligase RFWD3-like isoform X3 [Carex littledalei]